MGGVDGFGQELEVVAAGAGAGEDFNGGGLAAEEEDAGFGKHLADGDGGFDAVDVRHEDVGEDEVRVEAAGGIDGVLAAVDGVGLIAVADEDLNDGVGDEGFVVDDEDAAGRRAGLCLVVRWERGEGWGLGRGGGQQKRFHSAGSWPGV